MSRPLVVVSLLAALVVGFFIGGLIATRVVVGANTKLVQALFAQQSAVRVRELVAVIEQIDSGQALLARDRLLRSLRADVLLARECEATPECSGSLAEHSPSIKEALRKAEALK